MTDDANRLDLAEWIYLKLYLGQAVDKFDGLILETVPKILALERFERWFFLRYLDESGVAWVNVDQPLFQDSVKPAAAVTGSLGYVRLHGRNYEKWFAHAESWERYNYLYSKEELSPWVERIRTMAREKETYVITNNHFRGQAIVNAAELKEALGIEGKVPPQLKEVYAGRLP